MWCAPELPLPRGRVASGASLDEVGKVLSRRCQSLAVVASHVRACPVQGVQEPDRVDLGHGLRHLLGREPGDRRRLAGGALFAADRLAAEDQSHDASCRVLVDPGELVDLDVDARLFPDLAPYAGLRGLVEFEHPAREFPSAIVGTPDR